MNVYNVCTGLYMTNTYVIINGNRAVIIDPGDGTNKIIDFLARNKATAECVLITHSHFDHIGSVAALQCTGAKVYISKKDLDAYLMLKERPEYARIKPFSADSFVNDGQILELCELKFKAIATPGHTPGGMCYILNNECIFTGDTLFKLSIGRTDLPYGDRGDLSASLKRLFDLPENYTVYPGHGAPTTLDFERVNNPYADI